GKLDTYPLGHYWQLLLLGIILGLASRLYQMGLLKVPGMFDKIKTIPWYYKSLIPMLLVIPIGLFLPVTLGSGSRVILNISHVMPSLTFLLILLVVRFVFAMISYGAGVAGGFFMPILAVGALIGAIVGNVLYSAHLLDFSFVNNLIIFSMAAYFAGISKAPFTAIMLITELVGSMRNFMPLAFVVLVAYLVVDLTNGAPIYESLAERLATFKQLPIFKGRNEQIQIPVYAQSLVEDQQVRRIEWPKDSILATIRRGSHEIVPSGDTLIIAGDLLIFTVFSDNSGKIRTKLIALTQLLTENG
ncbi:chloride channel protein, partial [Pediococcus damnosus]